MSIVQKLTAAFLGVALLFGGLMFLQVSRTNIREVRQLSLDREEAELLTRLTDFYTERRSWRGIERTIQNPLVGQGDNGQPPNARQGGGQPPQDIRQGGGQLPPGNRPPPLDDNQFSQSRPFGVVNTDNVFIVPLPPEHAMGSFASAELVAGGTPIIVDAETVGTIISAEPAANLTPGEQAFLDNINRSLFSASLLSIGVALIFGYLLARTLTRPLHKLTAATRALSKGQLSQSIEIQSKDEIGELATAFNQMSIDLEHAKQQRDQMTADIAHDLRTPITVIGGYLEAMQDGTLKPTPDRLQTVFEEVQLLESMVGDLNTLASVDSAMLRLNCQPTDIAHLLTAATNRHAIKADQANITLQTNCPATLPTLLLDEDRMLQVLGNLISNALRYTPADGSITLTAQPVSNALNIAVADTGSGIDPQHLPHIFSRSYRADASRTEQHSGLGLAIVAGIVELQGGSVSAESTLNQGTTITLTFPLKNQP